MSDRFSFCLDCWEMTVLKSDKNAKVVEQSQTNTHGGHATHVFGKPADYPPPIKNILICLQADLPISDGRAQMFYLAVSCYALQPTNGVRPRMVAPDEPKQEAEGEREEADEKALF